MKDVRTFHESRTNEIYDNQRAKTARAQNLTYRDFFLRRHTEQLTHTTIASQAGTGPISSHRSPTPPIPVHAADRICQLHANS